MSNQDKKGLTGSSYKMRLEQMGMSFDRMYHPESYYEKMYLTTSNAKSKVTRNNTPFYHEQIINRKRERESNKKKKITRNKINDEDYSSSDDEEINLKSSRKRKNAKSQNKNINNENDINDTGIKVTRLIKRDKKFLRSDNNNLKELTGNEMLDKLRSPRTRRNLNDNKNKKNDDYIYYNEGFNRLKSKSKSKNKNGQRKNYKEKENKNVKEDGNKKGSHSKEKNIINISAQNNNYNEPTQKDQNDNMGIINNKSPEKNYYLNVEEKNNNQDESNIKLRSNNYNNPEENEFIQENLNNNDDNNIQINEELGQTPENQDNKEYTDVSSNYSQTTSYFSRFSGFTYLSLGKIGSGFVNMKNSIMNKFRRNAYLLPLIVLILFGIIFFLNEKYENFERNNIIIIFSILMGLIVLFHLYKCLKEKMKYKNIAKEHKKKLMKLLEDNNIKKEDIGNNVILLSQFFEEVINDSGIDYDTYIKYVFPYLAKYLKKDGYILEKQNDEENGENNLNYWKKM